MTSLSRAGISQHCLVARSISCMATGSCVICLGSHDHFAQISAHLVYFGMRREQFILNMVMVYKLCQVPARMFTVGNFSKPVNREDPKWSGGTLLEYKSRVIYST